MGQGVHEMANEPLSMQVVDTNEAFMSSDARLVDLIDGLLDTGVVIRGDVWLSVAEIDLVYLGISAVLANPDKVGGARRGQ